MSIKAPVTGPHQHSFELLTAAAAATMKLFFYTSVLASVVTTASGFGLTKSGNNFVVDTSGGLVFTGMFRKGSKMARFLG